MSAEDRGVEHGQYGEISQHTGDGQQIEATNTQTTRQETRRDSDIQQSGDDEVDYGDEAIPDPEPKPKPIPRERQQGTKRKAEEEAYKEEHEAHNETQQESTEDLRPVDPDALPALILSELYWWTTEEDVREVCAKVEAEEELVEVAFGEHKINGKSKGEAYLEFYSVQASTAVKREFDAASQAKEESGVRKSPFVAHYTEVGNPYYTPPTGGVKKESLETSRAGAYNSTFSNRGGFRGRGGYNRGGFNNNMRGGHQAGWGMNGGYGQNPMMGGYGMGGFGGMGRGGGMMNMMGGRGNFMSMGGNMMGGRGGGGWNHQGNFQGPGGGYNGGYYGGGPGNKRMRTE